MIRNAEYVIAAYSIVSGVLFVYTALTHIKLRNVNKMLKQLTEKKDNE